MLPPAVTKTPKLPVAPAPSVTVTVGDGGDRHAPVATSVRHTRRVSGRFTVPVSALTVMLPADPTLAVATAKLPAPVGPETSTAPALPTVAASAMTSMRPAGAPYHPAPPR